MARALLLLAALSSTRNINVQQATRNWDITARVVYTKDTLCFVFCVFKSYICSVHVLMLAFSAFMQPIMLKLCLL